jgi:predicted nuclease of predicted toxin-antitoxin system
LKLKLDENIPSSARARLALLGHDVDTVLDENLGGRADPQIWAAAQHEERLLVTQDMDFSDARHFAPGTHCGILVVRLPDSEQWRIADYLVGWFSSHEANTWSRCFVVATATRIRVRRPAQHSL